MESMPLVLKLLIATLMGLVAGCSTWPQGADPLGVELQAQVDWSYSNNVFIPNEHILMDGEYEFAQELVSRFTAYHRASYVCKTGLGDVMTGAAAQIAEYNGAERASHIKDKLVEITHLNETIYSSAIASSYEARQLESDIFINDEMLANVCKQKRDPLPL